MAPAEGYPWVLAPSQEAALRASIDVEAVEFTYPSVISPAHVPLVVGWLGELPVVEHPGMDPPPSGFSQRHVSAPGLLTSTEGNCCTSG